MLHHIVMVTIQNSQQPMPLVAKLVVFITLFSLGWLACAGFQPSNVRDEQDVNPCRDNGGKDESNKLIESQTGVQCKINSY